METFASEWQAMKEKRQLLLKKGEQLKQELASLVQSPETKEMLAEKNRLKKELPSLNARVEMHQEEIDRRRDLLRERRGALTDIGLKRKLESFLIRRRERLTEMEKLEAPAVILEDMQRMVFELEAPIEEAEERFRQLDAETLGLLEKSRRAADEMVRHIEEIEVLYRQTKSRLKEDIRKAEQEREECRAEQIEWASQNREHLEWVLEHDPSFRDDAVRRYRNRFPEDRLLDLVPPPSLAPTPTAQKKIKKRGQPKAPLPIAKSEEKRLPDWKFWVTFHSKDRGQELPGEKGQFVDRLQNALDTAALHSLSATLVHTKLLAVCSMEIQQRQKIKEIKNRSGDEELVGWKIIRVGKKHRLFLLINEEERWIRFLPHPRKTAYTEH